MWITLESYKNVHKNEIQSAYFGNCTFIIFTAWYTRSLDDMNDPKKDPIIVVSLSKEHNGIVSLTCLKKVIEKAERINVAKYNKIKVWSDGCSA